MKLFLSQSTLLIAGTFILLTFSSFQTNRQKLFSLTVETNNLRNNEGTVVFALYNREDAFPDEHYKKYFIMKFLKQKSSSKLIEELSFCVC